MSKGGADIPQSSRAVRALRARILPMLAPIWRRRLARLNARDRRLRIEGLQIEVGAGVFPPVFLSSSFLARELRRRRPLGGMRLLELGCGTGVLSVLAAKLGAEATACDIAPAAVQSCARNAARNGVSVTCLRSDLFQGLGARRFDLILINPPYYPRDPASDAERAWFCGAEFGYFRRLFAELSPFAGAQVLMVLSEDCALDRIMGLARDAGWRLTLVRAERRWFEWTYLFEITRP